MNDAAQEISRPVRLLPVQKTRVTFLILLAVIGCYLFFVQGPPAPAQPALADPSPAAACRGCHGEIYNSFVHTAHYLDSRPADTSSVRGSFQEGHNSFQYNPFMRVTMTREGDHLLQTATINGEVVRTADFDITIGSGRKGQSYLYWQDSSLYQLPVSYYRASDQWCNSPGFPKYFFFGRAITPNCLECHTTFARAGLTPSGKFSFDRGSLQYGITCERCHTGGQAHAAYQAAHPQETTARFVTNAAKLNRQQRMDGCALCHSGFRTAIQPPFSFQVGDTLAHFSQGKAISRQADTLDVHGNQYGLLAASKCFLGSAEMDCSTCHNVHRDEFNRADLFSAKCQSCHNGKDNPVCSLPEKERGSVHLGDNCIDCHMPVRASKKIMLNVGSGDKLLPDYIRTHFISIYPEATANFLKQGAGKRQ